MILVIDNYDSFTYNLVNIIAHETDDIQVIKNDSHTLEEIHEMAPKGILISPGPCTPKEAGICVDVVRAFYKEIPILGICLGHQCIGAAFNAKVEKANHICHGVVDTIKHDYNGLFYNITEAFNATRYHSLIVSDHHLSSDLMVTARAKSDDYIMGLRHVHYPVEGFQFHPESYLTPIGHQLIKNFVELTRVGGYYV